MKKMNNKGFSLIELIIVIAIMAVLVAIIAPNLSKYLGSSKKQTDKKNIDEVVSQVKNCISDASINDVDPTDDPTTSKAAEYTLTGEGNNATTCSAGANGTTEFAALITKALADTNTTSKEKSSNDNITITVTGSASDGYSVKAEFTS